jgi:DNA-binding response OmpR family regulator
MTKILLAEDDPNLGMLLQEYLTLKGYQTDLGQDGDEGMTLYAKNHYDLCIFDVMMPKKDGFTLAKEIRMSDTRTPIVFLTAKNMKEDTLQGFRLGADDYLSKPFSMEELLARIEAILRRTGHRDADNQVRSLFEFGDFTFDYAHQSLNIGQQKFKLTGKESELLKMLCLNMGSPVSRSYILKAVWGDDSYFNARSMDVYLTKLRKFLKEDPRVQIVNVHGEGFKLLAE